MKIRKSKKVLIRMRIEENRYCRIALNGTSDVQPAIPFLKKSRNEGRALCLQEMQAYGGCFCRDFLHNER